MQKSNGASQLLIGLGTHIRHLRQSKQITQSRLAINCGMEKPTPCKIESGMVNLGYPSLQRICKGLGVTLCELSDESKLLQIDFNPARRKATFVPLAAMAY